MTVVTNANVISTMADNLIYYLDQNVTDPNSSARSSDEQITNDNAFVRLHDGRAGTLLPHILVMLPPNPQPSQTTGILNQIREITFSILIHERGQLEAISLADEVYDALQAQTDNYFADAKMYPVDNWISSPGYYKAEDSFDEYYATLDVTFEYFHYES